MLGDLNEAFSPMAFVNGDPVNNIDIDGLYASNTFDGKLLGDGGGRVPGAPEEEKYQGKPKATIVAAEANYASLRAGMADFKQFMLSNGPAYSEMSGFRQKINDLGNSNFVRAVNEWNPYYHGANFISGTSSGKNIYGNPMSGGDVSFAAIGMIPGEGKIAEKIGIKIGANLIGTYSELSKLTKGFKGLLQAHHLAEARHLKVFGLSLAKAPSIILSKIEHTNITRTLRELMPYGKRYNKQEVISAYKKAYKNYPEWLKSTLEYLK